MNETVAPGWLVQTGTTHLTVHMLHQFLYLRLTTVIRFPQLLPASWGNFKWVYRRAEQAQFITVKVTPDRQERANKGWPTALKLWGLFFSSSSMYVPFLPLLSPPPPLSSPLSRGFIKQVVFIFSQCMPSLLTCLWSGVLMIASQDCCQLWSSDATELSLDNVALPLISSSTADCDFYSDRDNLE